MALEESQPVAGPDIGKATTLSAVDREDPGNDQQPHHKAEKDDIETPVVSSSEEPSSMAGTAITPTSTPTAPVSASDALTGFPLIAVIVGLCVGSFLMSLDVFIIATAIPSITAEFGKTSQIAWYPAAYSLTTCALIPLAGKMASVFSLRWVYQGFFAAFLVGSVVCGAASSSEMFIVGRALAGVGASGVASCGLTITLTVSSPEKRPLYMGIVSSMFALGIILAPIIGGAFTEKATWRWCFYVNLPTGVVTLASMYFFFRPKRIHADQSILDRVKQLDIVGCLMFVPACFMILIAMQWGDVEYPWKSATIIGQFVGGGVLILIFATWQWYMGDSALIPGAVVKRRNVWVACVFSFCYMGGLAVMAYYLPEWFQAVRGVSPLNSGVRVLPSVLTQIIGLLVVGVIAIRLAYYNPWAIAGSVFMAIAAGLFTTFTALDTLPREWIGYQVIQGLGVGITMQIPTLVLQQDLDGHPMLPVGVSMGLFSQYLGATVNQVIAGSVFNSYLKSSLKHKGLTQRQIALLLAGGTVNVRETTNRAFPELLEPVLEAYNFAITRVYFVPVVACCLGFFVALGLKWRKINHGKPKQSEEPDREEAPAKDTDKTLVV